ncbi:hypothetical protein ABTN54_19520, partial [Acinetobacter baumannii]
HLSLERIAKSLEAMQAEEKNEDRRGGLRENLTIILLAFTVIFTGASDVIFYMTMEDAHENADKQINTMNKQLDQMVGSSRQTDKQISASNDL